MCACAECRDRACSSSGCSFCTDRAHLSQATGVSPTEVCSFCLLSAALRSECVCGCSCVCFSLRGGNGAGPFPLLCPSLPTPHPCSQTLPAAAHFPTPGENWSVSHSLTRTSLANSSRSLCSRWGREDQDCPFKGKRLTMCDDEVASEQPRPTVGSSVLQQILEPLV